MFDKIFLLLVIMLLASVKFASAESVTVRNNVSSSANSGGNTGDNIQTSDAKASASVKNNISGDKAEVKTEIKAAANGEKVEINTESTEAGSQNIEQSAGGASATVETGIETENTDNNPVEQVKEEPGVIKNIINNISTATKNFFNNLKSLFI